MTTTLNFVDSEKGGTGKSWFARTLHHLFVKRNILFSGIDSDTANPTYHHIYPDTYQIPFSIRDKDCDLADEVFELARQSHLIVNLPAQANAGLSQWLMDKDVTTMAPQHHILLKKWWVSDGEEDSIQLFVNSVNNYGKSIQHIFVRNAGRCTEWEYCDSHQELQKTIAAHNIKVMDFPKLGDMRRIRINAERLDFQKALVHPSFGILGQAQVALYLKTAETVLEQAGAFEGINPVEKQKPNSKEH